METFEDCCFSWGLRGGVVAFLRWRSWSCQAGCTSDREPTWGGGGGLWGQFFSLMCPQCTEQCRAQNRGPGAGGGKNSFSSANPSPVARAKYRCWCLQNGQGEAWVLDTSFPTFWNHQRCLGAAFLMVRRNVLFNNCLVNVGKVP